MPADGASVALRLYCRAMAKAVTAQDIIWAPWRSGFVQAPPSKGCVFCRIQKAADNIESWILFRGKKNYVALNKYPYTSGHLLIIPYRHVGILNKLNKAEGDEHFALTRSASGILQKSLAPHGINIGMNLGRVAGAGIEGHVHTHLVPRWNGDNNFMPVIGATRILSIDLSPVYERLLKAFARLK